MILTALAGVGLAVLFIQRLALGFGLARPSPRPRRAPAFSILKPLCGVDDALEDNLASFAALEYPHFEVLLGVKDEHDAAWPIAQAMAARDPRFRVVKQQGSPGLNPKVNQLVTLAARARHGLLLISDSNARLPSRALWELAGHFEDPRVACVTNPVSGWGHESWGAVLDNLHLAAGIGAAQLAAKTLANRDLVVGKSMALRRSALNRLGGFGRYVDVLAEDYVIGQDVVALGLEVRVARTPVWNVSVQRPVRGFFDRYLRWGVIHRTAVTLPTSLAQGLVNPLPFALGALLWSPSVLHVAWFLGAWLVKAGLDLSSAEALRCSPFGWRGVPAVLLKDLIVFVTWFHGLWARTVVWRGHRLRVGARSQLIRPRPAFSEAA